MTRRPRNISRRAFELLGKRVVICQNGKRSSQVYECISINPSTKGKHVRLKRLFGGPEEFNYRTRYVTLATEEEVARMVAARMRGTLCTCMGLFELQPECPSCSVVFDSTYKRWTASTPTF